MLYKYQAKLRKIKVFIILLSTIYCCQVIAMQLPKLKTQRSTYKTYLSSSTSLSIINVSHYEEYLEQKLVAHYVNAYLKGNELYKLIKRSKPFLEHVITELEKRNLPRELALLPIVESAYRPFAVSNKGATGIWQISHVAGKRYGLICSTDNNSHDHRHDLIASTNAALSYLKFLYEKFDNDWLLAIAAYNAGEGRVSRAIKSNKIIGESTHYWGLALPKETKHYIPKLLALSIIFKDPKKFGLNFDSI